MTALLPLGPLQALSIRQPWAWAIVGADKRVENRSKLPPSHVLGQRMALHVSQKVERWGCRSLRSLGLSVPPLRHLTTGAIIGVARVLGFIVPEPVTGSRLVLERTSVVHRGRSYSPSAPRYYVHRADARLTDERVHAETSSLWWAGPCGWVLDDIEPCVVPVPCKGRLGVWNVDLPTAARVAAQVLDSDDWLAWALAHGVDP